MINTVVRYKYETFVLSFYRNDLLINGKILDLKSPNNFNQQEKEMVEKLKKEGNIDTLALFTTAIKHQFNYPNPVFNWLLIRILFSLYNRRNVIIGGYTVCFNDDDVLILGKKAIKLNKNNLTEEGKRIFGY